MQVAWLLGGGVCMPEKLGQQMGRSHPQPGWGQRAAAAGVGALAAGQHTLASPAAQGQLRLPQWWCLQGTQGTL